MKLTVVYDGPSRPMLMTDDKPPRFFSVSELVDGRWQSFDGEDSFCEVIAEAVTNCGIKLKCENGHEFDYRIP
jgi:hypothetical protein